jgi:hypothetical protein
LESTQKDGFCDTNITRFKEKKIHLYVYEADLWPVGGPKVHFSPSKKDF